MSYHQMVDFKRSNIREKDLCTMRLIDVSYNKYFDNAKLQQPVYLNFTTFNAIVQGNG